MAYRRERSLVAKTRQYIADRAQGSCREEPRRDDGDKMGSGDAGEGAGRAGGEWSMFGRRETLGKEAEMCAMMG
jgi:hypothetical protein